MTTAAPGLQFFFTMESSRETLLILFSIPLYAILIGAEILLSNWKQLKFYSLKSTLQNIYLTLLNAGIDLALRAVFYIAVLMWCYEHRFFSIENVSAVCGKIFMCVLRKLPKRALKSEDT